MIEEPWQSVASPMFRLSLVAPLALAPILVISLLGLWLSASQVVAPLRDLQGRAIKLAAGDFHAVETEIGGVQEIRDLQRSMVTMARRIQSAQQSLRRYIGKVTSIQEEERRRIARDLHDETIQDFIALDQKVQLLGRNPRGGKGRKSDSVETIHREAREAIQRVRRLSLALRPGYLEDLGLVPALEALANDVSSKAGIPISFHVTGTAAHQSSSVDLAIYRIVQESLSNVVRHAQAHHAWVDLRFAGEEVRLIVRDDGAGFVPPREAGDLTQAGHFGLVGMRERAQFIGGSLEVHSTPGKGTRLILRLPLQS
jgi:signal transduction histidine kinase